MSGRSMDEDKETEFQTSDYNANYYNANDYQAVQWNLDSALRVSDNSDSVQGLVIDGSSGHCLGVRKKTWE
jgi:hypothetical protein